MSKQRARIVRYGAGTGRPGWQAPRGGRHTCVLPKTLTLPNSVSSLMCLHHLISRYLSTEPPSSVSDTHAASEELRKRISCIWSYWYLYIYYIWRICAAIAIVCVTLCTSLCNHETASKSTWRLLSIALQNYNLLLHIFFLIIYLLWFIKVTRLFLPLRYICMA